MINNSAIVITSISAPNAALKAFAAESQNVGVDFIVVGDVKSPASFLLPGCDFLSIERQRKSSFAIAGILPENHYARKNLGYLLAIDRGAQVIIETDDDNFPLASFWDIRRPNNQGILLEDKGWLNVYRYFTDGHIWPRGFPLEYVQNPVPPLTDQRETTFFCPIQQGLADLNPDVDAVYRLTMPLPHTFRPEAPNIVLGRGSWCPFNSQNTTWFKEAFPLLYIPSYCSFRMCDIWRGFVALRICWANGWGVQFHSATVFQERNTHNLLKDLADEIPGYLNNAKICNELERLDIVAGADNIGDNMLRCYGAFVELGLIGESEIPLLKAWLTDVASVS